jgi:hypothetical protein
MLLTPGCSSLTCGTESLIVTATFTVKVFSMNEDLGNGVVLTSVLEDVFDDRDVEG